VWSFIKERLDERQRAKVNILGGPDAYLPELLKEVDLEMIPVALGGKDAGADYKNEQGPWADLMPKQIGPPPVEGPLSRPDGLPPAMLKKNKFDD